MGREGEMEREKEREKEGGREDREYTLGNARSSILHYCITVDQPVNV